MSKLRLMKAGFGDECLAEWDVETSSEAIEAQNKFYEAMRVGGRMAFAIRGAGISEPIKEFDPTAEDILIVPAIQGG